MKTSTLLITGSLIALVAVLLVGVEPAAAQFSLQSGVEAAKGADVPTNLMGDTGIITTVTNILLFVAGALAVIMLIWGGLRYTVSGGNAASVTAAKNTILYAIIGLIVAFLAFAVINFVLGAITIDGTGGGAGFTNV